MQNTIIKDYQVKSELGRGGMATVYLAHDIKFHTNVAIKVINKEYVHTDNIRKRFLAEARNMFRMSHPNIIKVTDLIDEGDTVAFVMEYIEGETLKEYLDRKGKLSDAEIQNLFSQMLEAVGYVHEQNLVHRDIKPSNFMITPKGQIKLLDFGIAKNTDTQSADYTQTGTSQNMGTPMYMSPEQIKSTKDVTLQSDIYSLGVVLWQIVMGKKPYDTNSTSTFELQMKIVQDDLPSTSKFWDSIIQKATQKIPEQRFQNIQAFQYAIKHPTKNTDHEQTIVNPKTLAEEETVVVQSNKKTNSASSSEMAATSKKESKNTHLPPNQEKKISSKKGIYIGIGVILVAVFIYLFKVLPAEEDVTVVEEVDINVGETIPEIGNSIIYTVRQYYHEEEKNNKYAVPIVVYFNGKYIEPPHCNYTDNSEKAIEECKKSKEILFLSVQPGSRLFEIDKGIQTNSIYVSDYENFGYSDWTLFSGKISNKINPSLLTDNHKIGTNRLAQIIDTPILEENRSLLGIIDVDGDGMPEHIYEVSEYEGTSYEILSYINGEWKVVYNGGYQGV